MSSEDTTNGNTSKIQGLNVPVLILLASNIHPLERTASALNRIKCISLESLYLSYETIKKEHKFCWLLMLLSSLFSNALWLELENKNADLA